MVAGMIQFSPSAFFFHGPAQDLARSRLGQLSDRDGELEGGDRADLLTHQRDACPLDIVRRPIDAGLQHDESRRAPRP